MTIYRVDVYRDDRWWMIRVPQLDSTPGLVGGTLTQARRFTDVPKEARDCICLVADVAPSTVELDIHATVADRDITEQARRIADAKLRAAELEREAIRSSRKMASELAADGVPVRDIGAILGVTHQRASQLATT